MSVMTQISEMTMSQILLEGAHLCNHIVKSV